MRKIKALIAGSVFALPVFVSAQTSDFSFLTETMDSLTTVLNQLIPFIIGLGVLVFLWGVLKFITAAGDEGARATGRSFMIWGIVGLFVMVSVWGLVNFLGGFFDLDNDTVPEAPGIPASNE
ncbi:MAG: pilin [Candidatus Paceibacterota bacterium]